VAELAINGSLLTTPLLDLLNTDAILPGSEPSYQTCKQIYVSHPLGAKMVDAPIRMAQFKPREIAVPTFCEEEVVKAFNDEWKAIGADKHIAAVARFARVYGVASIGCLTEDKKLNEALEFKTLSKKTIAFNIFDPLNTAGSLVLSQQPNSMDFLKSDEIRVAGSQYHRSRTCVLMHGDPIFIEYTSSAFGYVGRSVYQPALFPLKSFIQSMIADDLIVTKAGVIVAKIKQPGSIANQLMASAIGLKRAVVKEAKNYNVINITPEEDIQSIDLKNMEGPFSTARKDILENIAAADDMPAKILNQETFAEGFGEGTEDAKAIASYIDSKRNWMQPLYDYFTKIVQYRAWNEDFYKALQNKHSDLKDKSFNEAFYEWEHAFTATWPSLLTEPESELIRTDDVVLRSTISAFEVLWPTVQSSPEQAAQLIMWLCDQFNMRKKLFSSPLTFDLQDLIDTLQEKADRDAEQAANMNDPANGVPKSGKPENLADAATRRNARDAATESRRAGEGIDAVLALLTRQRGQSRRAG
jgi:hypothetical protein